MRVNGASAEAADAASGEVTTMQSKGKEGYLRPWPRGDEGRAGGTEDDDDSSAIRENLS